MCMVLKLNGIRICNTNTVEPPNKGYFGININSAVLSLVERQFSSRRFSMYENHREDNILGPEKVSLVERSNIQCPFFGGSTIGGSTVVEMKIFYMDLLAAGN